MSMLRRMKGGERAVGVEGRRVARKREKRGDETRAARKRETRRWSYCNSESLARGQRNRRRAGGNRVHLLPLWRGTTFFVKTGLEPTTTINVSTEGVQCKCDAQQFKRSIQIPPAFSMVIRAPHISLSLNQVCTSPSKTLALSCSHKHA